MKSYQEEWPESVPMEDFLQEFRKSGRNLVDMKTKCLTGYATGYHYSRRPPFVKGESILLLATIVLRLASAIMKRACVESFKKGQYVWFSFYCVGEVAGMAAIILPFLINRRSTFTRNFWLLFCLLVGIIGDTVSGAFSNGGNDETVDILNYISIAAKTGFEILKNAPACILLYLKVVNMNGSATPADVVYLLNKTPIVLEKFDYLPEGEKAWAYKVLVDELCEDHQTRARDDKGDSANIPTGDSSGSLMGERHDVLSFMRPSRRRHRSPEALLPV